MLSSCFLNRPYRSDLIVLMKNETPVKLTFESDDPEYLAVGFPAFMEIFLSLLGSMTPLHIFMTMREKVWYEFVVLRSTKSTPSMQLRGMTPSILRCL